MTTRTIPIALTLDDGSVAIMHFVVEGQFAGGSTERSSSDADIRREIARTGLAGRVTSWRRVEPSELPTDRRYRNSWKDFGDGVRLDMAKARAERLEQLRRQRTAVLDQLDRNWMRATGQGKKEEADEIEWGRQELRDMPQRVAAALEAAQTADDLDDVGLL